MEDFSSSDSDFDLSKSLPRKKSRKDISTHRKDENLPVVMLTNDDDDNSGVDHSDDCSIKNSTEELEFHKMLQSFDSTCNIIKFEGSLSSFSAEIRSNLGHKNDDQQTWSSCIKNWISEYSQASITNWILRTTNAEHRKDEQDGVDGSQDEVLVTDRKKLQYRRKYVCQHSSFNKVKSSKPIGRVRNRNCDAKVDISVKFDTKHTRRKDKYIKQGLLAVIKIEFKHSHHIDVAEAYSFLRVTKDTNSLFTSYFDDGCCAGSARSGHEFKLMMGATEEDVGKILANAQINPTARQVSHLYNQWRFLNFGGRTSESVLELLTKQKARYESEGIDLVVGEDPFTVIIITPLMKRVHQEQFAGEIVFIDSTGSCDQTQTCVTFIFTTSKVGALPLACILHSSQTLDCYETAFARLVDVIGSNGFGGCGYPEVIMTDDSDAERGALCNVFPNSRLLLCTFHICQALWRWLWDPKHKIDSTDRKYLMQQFRGVLYESDVMMCQELFNSVLTDERCLKYPNFIAHLNNYWQRKHEWAICFRQNLATRGNNTNNIVESSIRIFKEIVLQRSKSYNACALVQFITNIFEVYHKRKLLNFANSRVSKLDMLHNKLLDKAKDLNVTKINDYEFQVSSGDDSTVVYTVDIESESCDCPHGNGGRFCKHLSAVSSSLGGSLKNSPALTADDRALFAKIALGGSFDPDFYRNMVPVLPESSLEPSESFYGNVQDSSSVDNNLIGASSQTNQVTPSSFHNQIELLKDNYNRIVEMASQNYSPEFEKTLQTMNIQLSKIKTAPQLQLLHYSGKNMSKKRTIAVQPTSLMRRKKRTGFKQGAKAIQAGRPSNFEQSKFKRVKKSRNLGLNISRGQTNAKSHGGGH